MKKINVGIIGYGVVGSGVVKLLRERRDYIKRKFGVEIIIKSICDRDINKKKSSILKNYHLTTGYQDIIHDPQIQIVVELIGGVSPADQIVSGALNNKKHVVTANKKLLALQGRELFKIARRQKRDIYFEASVGAGIPIIKSITEGLAGNKFNGLYGIINGTSNFILSEMAKTECSFEHALKEAQKRGYAESNPALDISGMDSAHKLAILTFLALGKFIKVENIYVEGISHIAHTDIEHARSMKLVIKLLAIAKKVNNALEIRVHPTLIPKSHPLASVQGIFNAIFLDTDPAGDILLYGQGAGQMPAASGVVSDLINLAIRSEEDAGKNVEIISKEVGSFRLRKIDDVQTKFYVRLDVSDSPGVLAKIAGIFGKHGISIASVTQKARVRSSAVPIVMLTHLAKERMMRLALEKISSLAIVKSKPVAIRMEKLT